MPFLEEGVMICAGLGDATALAMIRVRLSLRRSGIVEWRGILTCLILLKTI
jgi:hypothetical protein